MQNKDEDLLQEHILYLDYLRDTEEMNMMGSAPYLAEEFDLGAKESRNLVMQWMVLK